VKFSGAELTVVIPTKDRPDELAKVLEALAQQTEKPQAVIVVDSGQSVEALVRSFGLAYLRSEPGQIRQRNLGIDVVQTPLVGFLDDDIVLEPGALEKVLRFWRDKGEAVAGVSMNLVNIPRYQFSFMRGLFFMSDRRPGRVLPSGYNIPIHNAASSFQSDWLAGGYTLWQTSVVRKFRQEPLKTKWAVGEDVRFSYPISKHHQLWVCADASVRDITLDRPIDSARLRFQGFRSGMAYFYLVEINPQLSKLACLYLLAASSSFGLALGLVSRKQKLIHRSLGELRAFVTSLGCAISGKSARAWLTEK
jgi:glycosyltransferase involved in cell wall biosynthesis